MAFTDSFDGTSLDAKWTFESGTPATTLSVAGGECTIVAKPGSTYEAPSQSSSSDTSFGISIGASDAGATGDFDVAIQAPTSLRSRPNIGWGVAFYGSTKSSDHVVVEQRQVGDNVAFATSNRILSRVSSTLTTHVNDDDVNEEYSFMRVRRVTNTWDVWGSWDGVTWTSLATFTANFTVDSVKVYGVTFGHQLGVTLRVSETYDTSGSSDVRVEAGSLTGATTWTTDFTSGIPAWLEDRSSNGGSASVVSNQLNLDKTTANASSAMVAHTERVSDVDFAVKFRLNSTEDLGANDQFFVVGIGGQYQTDQYSLDRSHIIEVDEDFSDVFPLKVHQRNVNADFNAIYDFSPDLHTPSGWANDQWQWVRFQRIGDRVRYRGWADGSTEPSTWDFDAHSEVWQEPGKAWIAWGSNESSASATTLLVDEITIQGVEVTEEEPSGVDAITGLVGHWRSDSLDGFADTSDAEIWEDISEIGQHWLTQAGANAPTYSHAAIGTENALLWNDGAERLVTPDFPVWFDLSALTMVAVLQVVTTTGTRVLLDGTDEGGVTGRNAVFHAGGTWQYYAGGAVDSADAVDTNDHVVTTIFAGTRTNSAMYLDGTQIGTGDPGAHVLTPLYVGAEDSGANPGDAYIAEIRLYDHELSADERSILHSYVQDRYGITVSDYTLFVDAEAAEFSITADDAEIPSDVPAEGASLIVAAQDAAVTASADISANAALFNVAAQDATVTVSADAAVNAEVATISVSAQDPGISASSNVAAETATISFASHDAIKRTDAGLASFGMDALNASIQTTADPVTFASPDVASIAVAAQDATALIAGEQVDSNALVASLSVSAFDATVSFITPPPPTYTFTTPSEERHHPKYARDPYLSKFTTYTQGLSVVKRDGTWITKEGIVLNDRSWVEGVDYFVGGYTYTEVPEDVALELIADGYSPTQN